MNEKLIQPLTRLTPFSPSLSVSYTHTTHSSLFSFFLFAYLRGEESTRYSFLFMQVCLILSFPLLLLFLLSSSSLSLSR